MNDPAAIAPPTDPAGAAELAAIDAHIRLLVAQSEQARTAWAGFEAQLVAARRHRDTVIRRLAAGAGAPASVAPATTIPAMMPAAGPVGPVGRMGPLGPAAPIGPMGTVGGMPPVGPPGPANPPPPGSGYPPAPGYPPSRPESSTKTVQNVLFILGGLLLGTAAIVFTAVAWATYGVGGRAVILAVVTALMLTAPLVALRRGLTATAETFAAVGLLLVGLDGYAAWYVNLFGVAGGSGPRYAGTVALVTAVVAAGYGALTRLTGPTVVARLTIQPVIPLLAGPVHPDAAGWSLIFAAVAALNLIIVARPVRRVRRVPEPSTARTVVGQTLGWALFGVTVALAGIGAGIAELMVRNASGAALAGLAVITVAAVVAGAAAVSRADLPRSLAATFAVLAVTLAVGVYVAVLRPSLALATVAAAVAGVAALAQATGRLAARSSLDGQPAPTHPDAGDGARPAPANPDAGPAPVRTAAGPGSAGRAVRSGTTAGTAITVSTLALVVFGLTLVAAGHTVGRALPGWRSSLATAPWFTWQLLAAIGLATAAGWLVLERTNRAILLAVAAVMLVLAGPDSVHLTWWAPSTVDLLAAGAFLLAAVTPRPVRATGGPAAAAAILALHALAVGLARPASTAAVLSGLVILGLTAGLLPSGPRVAPAPDTGPIADTAPDTEASATQAPGPAAVAAAPLTGRAVGGWAFAIGLLAFPPAVGAALVAGDRAGHFHLTPAWTDGLIMAAVGLVLATLFAVSRWRPGLVASALTATLASAAGWPVVAVLADDAPAGIYGALSLLLIAAATIPALSTSDGPGRPTRAAALPLASQPATVPRLGQPAGPASVPLVTHPAAQATVPLVTQPAAVAAAVPGAVLFAVGVLPSVAAVIGGPFAWLGAIWSGPPAGVGLVPPGSPAEPAATGAAAWSLGLLALACAAAVFAATRRIRAALAGLGVGGPTAIVVGVAAAGLPWPAVPAVTLLLGLALVLLAAIAPWGRVRTVVAGGQAVCYLGAGLAGTLTVRWSTITGLASIVVVAAVIGAVGRTVAWRVAGWLAAVTAALALAIAAGLAADLTVRATAFPVLAVAIAALALSAAGRSRRPVESTAIAAAAHAGAVVGLMLTAGWTSYSALLSAVWGVAVGLRAIWPGTSRSGRAALAATGAAWELLAWWLLLSDRGVTLVEAYTLPLAGVGLLAGWAALRARPELHSWVSYGPALAAAFLPSLALVLPETGAPGRRLALGLGALVVVVAGSIRRRQAPVVAGGAVLVMLALHELVLVWDLLPRWIPLASGGLILVGLAITYERRLRDAARLRAALRRMS